MFEEKCLRTRGKTERASEREREVKRDEIQLFSLSAT